MRHVQSGGRNNRKATMIGDYKRPAGAPAASLVGANIDAISIGQESQLPMKQSHSEGENATAKSGSPVEIIPAGTDVVAL